MKKDKKNKKNKGAQQQVPTESLITSSLETGVNSLEVNKSSLHDLLAPSGIDATHYDYLEIFSKVSRFARTFYSTNCPK